jgi:hypothetical protein
MSVTTKREGRSASRSITVEFVRDVAKILSEAADKYVTQQLSMLGPEPRESPWKWQYRRDELNALRNSTVVIETRDGDEVTYNLARLGDIRFPPNIKEISIVSGTGYGEFVGKVTLDFATSIFSEGSKYRIQGNDKQSVLGLEATLRQKLSEDRSLRDVLYRWEFLLPIDFAIATLNSWVYWILARILNPSISRLTELPLVILTSLWVMPLVLCWLFPFFTYADDSRNSTRRLLKSVFAVFYGALNLLGLLVQLGGSSFYAGSTQTVTSTLTTVETVTVVPAVPGFLPESIVAGLLLGLIALVFLRKQRRKV